MKRVETNLEHYLQKIDKYYTQAPGGYDYVGLVLDEYALMARQKSGLTLDVWLVSPYKEEKTRFKLRQFEYDFIKAFQESYGDNSFLEWAVVRAWQKKGYLKDVPLELEVKTILDNAEVINDD